MKSIRWYCFLFILVIFYDSCSKKNVTVNPGPSITLQVVEYKTDSPLAGAIVAYFTPCTSCRYQSDFNLVFSTTTIYDGKCEVPESIFNDTSYGVLIVPPQTLPGTDYNYWQVGSKSRHSSQVKIEVPAVGNEIMHLIKTNNFPKGFYMQIFATGEKPDFNDIYTYPLFGFPSDTSFYFYVYRGQTNTITWKIYDSTNAVLSAGGPLTINFPKTGINGFELKY